jgi:hypothetical protein
VIWQLRLYSIREGEWDDWVREWRDSIAPLRRRLGFEVLGPWRADDGRFAWMIGHEDFDAADEAYYASPARAALAPDPARHLAETETLRLEEI